MPILPDTSSTPDVPADAFSLELLDERPLGEGEPGLVPPVIVLAELTGVFEILFDEP